MLSLSSASLGFAPVVPAALPQTRAPAPVMETVQDLKNLAVKLNPSVGYWNPTGLADMEFWGQSQEATIGFLRQSEIKHGRVAMAAFVGFCLQSNGVCFPWNLQGQISDVTSAPTISFADISAAGGPADQWDALPSAAKLQILAVIGFLEMWSETSYALELDGQKHYVRGGKPGHFPSLKKAPFPHPVPLDLWDPVGFTKKMTPERKEKALLAEINNGRLAMIGIMGMLSASKGLIVPGLDTLDLPSYSGEVMAPFSSVNAELPYVSDMLSMKLIGA